MTDVPIFCSTIIPTINRATLPRAVYSVLNQEFDAAEFEVIVVNDSGQPLPDADWQHSNRVRVINTNRWERSVARNTGAAIAKGKYFHFLDDDDILLPGALQAFWQLSQEIPDAAWLYGAYQTVDSDGHLIDEFHPGIHGNIFPLLISGEAIPFQASLLHCQYFYAAGTFDPNIIGVEDRDLGRRIALRGSVAYMPVLVATIRIGQRGSTTNWKILAEDDRWGREKALSLRGAFARLCASPVSAYWRGRVSRAYLASMVWNLKRRQLFTALSRAVAGLAFASWYWLSPNFWNGLRTKVN
ncbi:MAG: glycosyltransferase family 2 protein [candidate division KSB1 bacterium]|nr:glycosyltransferase family 2 protein [candidate division KSB1 bacterium]